VHEYVLGRMQLEDRVLKQTNGSLCGRGIELSLSRIFITRHFGTVRTQTTCFVKAESVDSDHGIPPAVEETSRVL